MKRNIFLKELTFQYNCTKEDLVHKKLCGISRDWTGSNIIRQESLKRIVNNVNISPSHRENTEGRANARCYD